MVRPPRLEYPGALYHVTARGVRQDAIFQDDRDRQDLLKLLAGTLRTSDAKAFAYCLMGNHYHFVIQTRRANLSALMHRINFIYCQSFNQRHDRRGHVLEGRFKAIHVDSDSYLLEVCRYVDLNPVRAGLVAAPAQWPWSSFRAHTGIVPPPYWLATAELHDALSGSPAETDSEVEAANRRYADWVNAGLDVRLWKDSLRRGLYLGDEAFIERIRQAGA